MYQEGSGVEQDSARASALYRQACDGEVMEGCTRLGLLYREGEGVPADTALAATLFRQACEGGHLVGCSELGTMFAAGEGVDRDAAHAAGLFRQACDGEVAAACVGLGALHATGEGVPYGFVSAVRMLSIRYYAIALMHGLDERRFAADHHLSVGAALVARLLVFAGFLPLSIRRLRRMDVP
jgi:TPR repeat protein